MSRHISAGSSSERASDGLAARLRVGLCRRRFRAASAPSGGRRIGCGSAGSLGLAPLVGSRGSLYRLEAMFLCVAVLRHLSRCSPRAPPDGQGRTSLAMTVETIEVRAAAAAPDAARPLASASRPKRHVAQGHRRPALAGRRGGARASARPRAQAEAASSAGETLPPSGSAAIASVVAMMAAELASAHMQESPRGNGGVAHQGGGVRLPPSMLEWAGSPPCCEEPFSDASIASHLSPNSTRRAPMVPSTRVAQTPRASSLSRHVRVA